MLVWFTTASDIPICVPPRLQTRIWRSTDIGFELLQARQQAKEMLWMRQSENMVLEAMTRLSSVHDALEEMLGGAVKPILTTTPGLQSRGNSFTSNASSHRQAFKR